MLRKASLIVVASAFLSAAPAMAQTKGPNGGLLDGKGGHQTELVVGAGDLTVYVIDDGKTHSVKGLSLRAIVQEGGKNRTVELKPDGDKLVGKLAAPLEKGAIVVLTGKDDHGHAISSRYVIQ